MGLSATKQEKSTLALGQKSDKTFLLSQAIKQKPQTSLSVPARRPSPVVQDNDRRNAEMMRSLAYEAGLAIVTTAAISAARSSRYGRVAEMALYRPLKALLSPAGSQVATKLAVKVAPHLVQSVTGALAGTAFAKLVPDPMKPYWSEKERNVTTGSSIVSTTIGEIARPGATQIIKDSLMKRIPGARFVGIVASSLFEGIISAAASLPRTLGQTNGDFGKSFRKAGEDFFSTLAMHGVGRVLTAGLSKLVKRQFADWMLKAEHTRSKMQGGSSAFYPRHSIDASLAHFNPNINNPASELDLVSEGRKLFHKYMMGINTKPYNAYIGDIANYARERSLKIDDGVEKFVSQFFGSKGKQDLQAYKAFMRYNYDPSYRAAVDQAFHAIMLKEVPWLKTAGLSLAQADGPEMLDWMQYVTKGISPDQNNRYIEFIASITGKRLNHLKDAAEELADYLIKTNNNYHQARFLKLSPGIAEASGFAGAMREWRKKNPYISELQDSLLDLSVQAEHLYVEAARIKTKMHTNSTSDIQRKQFDAALQCLSDYLTEMPNNTKSRADLVGIWYPELNWKIKTLFKSVSKTKQGGIRNPVPGEAFYADDKFTAFGTVSERDRWTKGRNRNR